MLLAIRSGHSNEAERPTGDAFGAEHAQGVRDRSKASRYVRILGRKECDIDGGS